MNIAKWALCALAIAAACTPSAAHDHATGIVKERMEAMTSMAKRQKAISQHLKDKRELATIKADAEAIASLASHIPHMFPAGSTQPPTQARGTIWQNVSDFESKARALETASRALAATSPGDSGALGLAAAAVTRECSGCHEKYRVRKK